MNNVNGETNPSDRRERVKRLVIRDGATLLGMAVLGREPTALEMMPANDSLLLHAACDNIDMLKANYTRNTARLQILWEWLQSVNEDTGLDPPKECFEWFDEDGVPKRFYV